MLKNYFKSAFRSLAKSKLYAAINIIGLSVSLAASVLLLLWVWDELSFDQMHSKGDRIFRASGAIDKEMTKIWSTSAPLAVFGKNELPAVEDACRINTWQETLVDYKGKKFKESVYYVDPSFFSIFDFPLIAGNEKQPFPDKHSIVLSKSLAEKIFGKEEAVGKVVKALEGISFRVSGVIEDIPKNSSIRNDFFIPFDQLNEGRESNPINADWGNFGYDTYFLLKSEVNAKEVGLQLAALHKKNQSSDFFKDLVYLMQPLHKIHLYDPKGDEQGMRQVKIFTLIALVILLIACINYINLVTARSARRSKEVSVRKVVGANRTHLFLQFLTESLVVFLISMLLSWLFSFLAMPIYNQLSGKEMSFSLFDSRVWALFGAALILVLLMAGIYPAITLSRFNPALGLKGLLPRLGSSGSFRKVLVVLQFTCSVVLIVSTIVIAKQLSFIQNKNLGYDKENILTFGAYNFGKHYAAVRSELENNPSILGVTVSSQGVIDLASATGDIVWEGKPDNMGNFMINQISADRNFLQVLNMRLAEGKGFSGTPADSGYYILNEQAIAQMNIENPVGKTISFHDKPGIIAGVVKDFHFKNMRNAIEPCLIFMDENWGWQAMYVKIKPQQAQQAIAAIETLWKKYNADYDFNYQFMDEAFDNMYKSDMRAGRLFNIFAGIAILLSCLGLFGLVTYTAETKFKEIGIRKTLGASVSNIILLISKDFMKLVGISFILSFPIAWWMMSKWLENYVYRTELHGWVFIAAGLIAFAIAGLTVCGQSLKAAKNNPIKAIRTE
ncbi:ABC transporter permease [Olivibacter sp. 47]|uniref:ABC transporter permease n=1 Tax=Olivibacter sp. 47 TaxID=3056486 RepID=UPI0025A47BA9|nr:ABC transporter permease [Olivibacter sp. 47]MDM8177323.1 ABC transporter permease [Olivibacter sp. 47]